MKKGSLAIKWAQKQIEAITCPHNDRVYLSKIKSYSPQPRSGGKVFSVELICKNCGGRLVGQVQEQK